MNGTVFCSRCGQPLSEEMKVLADSKDGAELCERCRSESEKHTFIDTNPPER